MGQYLDNGKKYVQSYYQWLTGKYICAFDWHQDRWPWMLEFSENFSGCRRFRTQQQLNVRIYTSIVSDNVVSTSNLSKFFMLSCRAGLLATAGLSRVHITSLHQFHNTKPNISHTLMCPWETILTRPLCVALYIFLSRFPVCVSNDYRINFLTNRKWNKKKRTFDSRTTDLSKSTTTPVSSPS